MDSKTVNCVICNKPVALESAKVDEAGRPVHDACYLRKIERQPPSRPPDESKS
jgi:hypothetical protein